MILHAIKMGILIMLILLSLFLPFLPGSYDGFAGTLSAMAQIFGIAGLILLVPIGGLWLIYELRKLTGKAAERSGSNKSYYVAMASLVALSILAVFVSVTAMFNTGFSLGIALLVLLAYCISRMSVRASQLKSAGNGDFNGAPLYLVVLPIVTVLFQFSLMGSAVEFSRNRAIANSASMISDIERYREANGVYPASLLALHPDYKPSVIGIKQFHYERSGDAYNVYFEQLSDRIGTREIVMYNKLDQHAFASHDAHILEANARSGSYALNDAPTAHWKYFWFD